MPVVLLLLSKRSVAPHLIHFANAFAAADHAKAVFSCSRKLASVFRKDTRLQCPYTKRPPATVMYQFIKQTIANTFMAIILCNVNANFSHACIHASPASARGTAQPATVLSSIATKRLCTGVLHSTPPAGSAGFKSGLARCLYLPGICGLLRGNAFRRVAVSSSTAFGFVGVRS